MIDACFWIMGAPEDWFHVVLCRLAETVIEVNLGIVIVEMLWP